MKTEETVKIIVKEHRVLDDTDLVDIDNTFQTITSTLESMQWVINFGFGFMGVGLTCLGLLIAFKK